MADKIYTVEWAKTEDWRPAMDMIWNTFLKYEADDYTPEGIQSFWEFVHDDRLYHMFLDGLYPMLIARVGRRIVGAITVRNRNFISLLFVDEEFHRMGIGAELVRTMAGYLKYDCGEQTAIVKSAPYAVNFYLKAGFEVTGAEEHFSGIRVTPMVLKL